ncbi:hypothetical protein [Candidatus Nitrospira bockiana]
MTAAPWSIAALVLALVTATGCGVIGPPVPPETVGVGAKLRREQLEQQRREQAARRAEAPAGPEEPPLITEPEPPAGGTPEEELARPGLQPTGDVRVRPR